jgi:rhodanese-related sulfurtransferase
LFIHKNQLNNVKNISSIEMQQLLQEKNDAQIIDVRTPEEVAEGIIPNAVNINLFDLDFVLRIQSLDRNKPCFVVCRSGGRSASAAGAMVQWGFKEVYNLDGGMMDWDGEVDCP